VRLYVDDSGIRPSLPQTLQPYEEEVSREKEKKK
jgi:hypothetical protein